MAHSYLAVGDRLERIYDIDLLVLVHLLLRHAEASGNEHPKLIESLRKTAKTQGPGVVDVELNWIIADPSRKSHLLSLLDAIDRELDQVGEAYPPELLRQGWPFRGVIIKNDFKTARIRSVVLTARNLVKQG
jgi:hypothetical protein